MEPECFGARYFGAFWSSLELRYFLHVTYSTLMRKILLPYHTNYFFLGDITYVEDPTLRLSGKLLAKTCRSTPNTRVWGCGQSLHNKVLVGAKWLRL
jgi:hypothetical protein